MKKLIVIVLLMPLAATAQIGGALGYQSLNLTTNPRAAALAGTAISLADGDISQFFENPATLDSVKNKSFFVQINPYFADATVYTGAYSFNLTRAGTFAFGIQYVSFGAFEMTDETGQVLGTFQAQDYTLQIAKSHQLGPFTFGASLKLVHSGIESYRSSAWAVDFGGIFRPHKNWTVAMVFENMGGRFSEYTGLNSPEVPFDVKLGTSFKPEYMPIRFTLTSTNLVSENLRIEESASGRDNATIDKIWRRVNLGAEVLLSKHVNVLLGYNHKRKQELRLNERGAGAGFSYGLMVRIKRMELRFSRAKYHAAGAGSFISLRTNFNDFNKIL